MAPPTPTPGLAIPLSTPHPWTDLTMIVANGVTRQVWKLTCARTEPLGIIAA